ncbi:Sec1 domain containing protein 1 [Chamberlinius hualienensis]
MANARSGTSLREREIEAIRRMLNLNIPGPKISGAAEPVWKILVYDRFGQDIISPLVSVKELREMGVTLHLLLHSDRQPIPDVPVVYFVMPTEDNINRIAQDFQNHLYDSYYLNFASAVSRNRLEELANAAVQANCVQNIHKVFDQYQNFITLEDDLFVLRHQNSDQLSFYAINKGNVKDTEMEAIIDNIVDSLFSVFVTLGQVPVIRCPKGNAAEMIAEKLNKKLHENFRDARNSLFTADNVQSGQMSFQRPLLVILDRVLDLATPLHHTWTYQALIHDVMEFNLNRVKMVEDGDKPASGARQKKKPKYYDLGPSDKFWQLHKGSPFPTVAEAIQSSLDSYRKEEGEIKHLKEAMGLENDCDDSISLLPDNTAKLTSAVSSLPELMEKKRLIDLHTTVATSVLELIKNRKLDVYFECEEKIMSKAAIDKSLTEIITDSTAGSLEDKMRLFLIYYICSTGITDVEFDQYCLALKNAGCDLSPLQYIKRWKAYSKMSLAPNQYGGGSTRTINMFSKLMSQGSQFVMEGVKNLVVKKHNLPVTRIADALMELKSTQETDDYRYFDPKVLRDVYVYFLTFLWFATLIVLVFRGNIPRSRYPFQEAVVFVVGGGNYIEYQNLVDYAKSKTGATQRRVIYGSTELLNASQFLEQLSKLGSDIS